MKKKICIFIIIVVFTFVGLKTINASTLADMDPRQRNVWLDIISNEFHDDSEYQYISSINEDVILTMKDVATGATRQLIDEVFNKDNIRLVLTDESPESKLLGKQINLKYDK